MTEDDATAKAKAERKRKRLEAWRKRQKEKEEEDKRKHAPPKVILSLSNNNNHHHHQQQQLKKKKKKRKRTKPTPLRDFDDDHTTAPALKPTHTNPIPSSNTVAATTSTIESTTTDTTTATATTAVESGSSAPKKKRNRWDAAPKTNSVVDSEDVAMSNSKDDDALDSFMEQLESGAMGKVALIQQQEQEQPPPLKIDVGGSMMKVPAETTPLSGGVITAEEFHRLHKKSNGPLFTPTDWESDVPSINPAESSASEMDTDDEDEEVARRKFIEALKHSSVARQQQQQQSTAEEEERMKPQLASEVKSEKQRREDRLRQLEQEAEAARMASQSAPEIGRMFNDMEGGVMEEAERTLEVLTAAPDALEVLAELNKKKELKAVDHSTIDYLPIRKNLYLVPRSLQSLSSDDIADRRAKLKISIRGRTVPAPVTTFRECGLSERILSVLEHKQKITTPFPVQAQCLPCIMAGRDVIGIAKTGSGKTLAYLLPMLRHIGDQSPLAPNESGPIGLVLAPARELAVQIHAVAKVFCKHLGFNIYT